MVHNQETGISFQIYRRDRWANVHKRFGKMPVFQSIRQHKSLRASSSWSRWARPSLQHRSCQTWSRASRLFLTGLKPPPRCTSSWRERARCTSIPKQAEVGTGQAILIPPGSWQHIRNTGRVDLKFLCIVHPMWRAEDEESFGLDSAKAESMASESLERTCSESYYALSSLKRVRIKTAVHTGYQGRMELH